MQVQQSSSRPGRTVLAQGFFSLLRFGVFAKNHSTRSRQWIRRTTGIAALLACASPLAMYAQVPHLTISSASVAFGSVALNTTVTQSINVSSNGTAPVVISGDSVSNSAFSIPGATFPVQLPAGFSGQLPITFKPTSAGSYSGTVSFMTNTANGGVIRITVSGTGTAPTAALSSVACTLGSIASRGTASCGVSLTAAAPAGGVTVKLASSSGSLSLPATVTVPAGTSSAGFTATAATVTSNTSGTITATSGSITKSVSLQLIAEAANLTLSTTTLSFGTVTLNQPASLILSATSSGTAPVIVTGAAVTGTGFSFPAVTSPVTLNPGQIVSAPVTFIPPTAGAVNGSITIRTSSGLTLVVALSGTGSGSSGAALTLGSSTISFGSVSLNSTSTQSLTLRSTGSSALTISGGSVTGTGFSMPGAAFPITLTPGQAATLEIAFDPTTAGAQAGKITLSSNAASGSTATVALSGTGQAASYSVDLNWSEPSGGSDSSAIAGYNIYRAPSGTSSYQKLNSTPTAATAYADTTVASGTVYSYEVTTVDAGGAESAPSNVFTAAIP